jgi:DNA-binding FadR family transcriptional regulator
MLEPIKTEKLYNLIMRRIFDLIKEENLKPGDKLPSERALATALSVSRASVRQAIAALSAKGAIVMRQGDGTYVSNPDAQTLESFGQFLAGSQIDPDEILEVRILVECEGARLCAIRADDQHLSLLQDILKEHEKISPQWETPNTLNKELHTAIVQGAQNKALLRITDVVWDIMRSNMWPLLKKETTNTREQMELHWRQHKEIVSAICLHDSDGAYKAMYSHLSTIKKDMDALISSSCQCFQAVTPDPS